MSSGLRFTLDVDGLSPEALTVISFRLTQSLSTLFTLDISLVSLQHDIDFAQVLEKTAYLKIRQDDEIVRRVKGIVTRCELGESDGSQMLYHMQIRPPLWRAGLRQNFCSFQNQSIKDILGILLQENDVTEWSPLFSEPLPAREFCVQYGETDYEFFARMAAEEGIFFYEEHAEKSDDQSLVLCDTVRYLPEAFELPWNPNTRTEVSTPCISSFRHSAQIRPSSVIAKDYTFKRPGWAGRYEHEAEHLAWQRSQYEVFDYPGRFKGEHGKNFARWQTEGWRSNAEMAEGKTRSPAVWPGRRITLSGHPQAGLNREWQVVASVLTGSQPQAQPGRRGTGTTLDNHFMVIPADRTWRPQPLPKPKVDGPQSAVVTGPEGEEIFCDGHGRVRVKFNWDRYNPADQHSSCWIRVAQAWAGAGFGNLAIPRVGQEVIVDFLNGDPDQPIITGRTYHADNRSPGSLPGTKTQMTIRSKTYMGSGFNELRFDDATNREQVYIHAQKNMDTEVLNNRTTDVKVDHTETIGNNQTVTVAHDRQVTVRNDQTLNVRHDRRVSVSHDNGLYVANDRTVTVEGSQAQTTRGNHVSRVEGRHSLEVQGDLAQKVAGALGVKVQGDIVLESSGRITLKTGNSYVVIHAGGVDISGPGINLNGGGSPGTPVGTLSPAVLKATAEEGDDTVLTWQKTPGTTSTEPLTNPWVEPATSSVNNQNLKPVIRLSDAPGINGLNQSSRPWQIVMADTYIQAVTTDEVLMKGQTDANGNVTPTEAQQQELAKLASQFQSQLWLIAGHRAHRLSFNMISSSASSEVQDNCAQDAMGFHSLFNKVTGHALPGEKFKQCILSEHATNGTMLKPLREEK